MTEDDVRRIVREEMDKRAMPSLGVMRNLSPPEGQQAPREVLNELTNKDVYKAVMEVNPIPAPPPGQQSNTIPTSIHDTMKRTQRELSELRSLAAKVVEMLDAGTGIDAATYARFKALAKRRDG